MEIIFHEKTNIDGCDGKKEIASVIFHQLHSLSISLYVSQNKLKRQYSTTSKISLRILTLKSKFEPFFT